MHITDDFALNAGKINLFPLVKMATAKKLTMTSRQKLSIATKRHKISIRCYLCVRYIHSAYNLSIK